MAQQSEQRTSVSSREPRLHGNDDRHLTANLVGLERLHPNPHQPRRHFDDGEVQSLAESIKENGVLQPVLVRPHPTLTGEYEIVAGERRWRAAKRAGLARVPVVLRQMDDVKALEIAIVENVQRQNLSPVEEAQGYRRLVEEYGYSQQDLARMIGKSRSHIANTLRLLNLPHDLAMMLDRGELSAGHGRALLGSQQPESLAKRVVAEKLSVRETERLARGAEAFTPPQRDKMPSPTQRVERDREPRTQEVGHETRQPIMPPPMTKHRKRAQPKARLHRSLINKLILLVVVFIAVPMILYGEFRQANEERQKLLIESVRERGRLIAESLRPLVEERGTAPFQVLGEEIHRLGTAHTGIKVLFRPAAEQSAEGFFFVATEPVMVPALLAEEQQQLLARGVLDELGESCAGNRPTALRYRLPSGLEEILTSITPITTEAGCWAIITTHSTRAFLGTAIGQPYWKTLEVKVAAIIYVGMALLTFGVIISVWRDIARFRRLARDIRIGDDRNSSFVAANKVPELAPVAEEFDRMTRSLQESAENIRRAAEDNAHAFKTPIAIMRQSLEPLSRLVPGDSFRGRRALDILEESIDRLDHLVACARQMEETTAELLDPPREPVALSRLLGHMLDAYADTLASRNIRLRTSITPDLTVLAGEELLETVVENIVENAISFSPEQGELAVILTREDNWAEIKVLDDGPGVPDALLERIFERYFSNRQEDAESDQRPCAPSLQPSIDITGQQMGIGLWIVRRNLDAVGGEVSAMNRDRGGLMVTVRIPLVLA